VAAGDAGNYTCVIGQTAGTSLTSSIATLTVLVPPTVLSVTSSLANGSYTVGQCGADQVTFSPRP